MIRPGVWIASHYQFASDPKEYNAELFRPLEVAPNSSKDSLTSRGTQLPCADPAGHGAVTKMVGAWSYRLSQPNPKLCIGVKVYRACAVYGLGLAGSHVSTLNLARRKLHSIP